MARLVLDRLSFSRQSVGGWAATRPQFSWVRALSPSELDTCSTDKGNKKQDGEVKNEGAKGLRESRVG